MTGIRSRVRPMLVAAALLLSTVAAAPAPAQEWTYRVRPGDNIWDLAAKYLRPGHTWQQLQAHNQVTDPYKLPPGSKLHFPVAWLRAEPRQATVVEVNGNATVTLPGQSAAPASARQALPIGTRIDTSDDASLTLQFADGSRLLLRSGSQLLLDRLSSFGDGAMVDTRLRLQRGRITNAVRKQPNGGAASFHVTTPNASSAVRGTVFRVDASEEATQAEVLEGSVAVSAGRRQTLLRKGFGTTVAAGSSGAIRSVPLLAAPDLSALEHIQRKVRPELQWPAVAGAARYQVQVATTPEFATLVVDKAYEEPHAVLPVLDDGDYAVRIAAIDANGLEGREAQATISVQARPEPPFVIAPVAGGTVKSPQPRFRWTAVEGAASYRIQVATDAAFEHIVAGADAHAGTEFEPQPALAPGEYYWRIATRLRDGRIGPDSDAMQFTLKPLPQVERMEEEGNSRALTLRWPEGDPSWRYRFQASRDKDFRHIEIDQVLDQPQVTLRKPGSGTWYVRAQTIDAEGFEGPFPAPQQLQLPCRPCQFAAGAGALLLLIGL